MSPEPASGSAAESLRSRIVPSVLGLAAFILCWFGIAGRLDWWPAWALLLLIIIYIAALVWRLSKLNPDLIRERNQPADVAEPWDRAIMRLYSANLVLVLILCSLDGGRYRWSAVPPAVQLVGWLLLVAAGAMIWQVMMINAYLSSWARLQEDRGQVVVQEGPYRLLRHPMYLAIILAFLGMPLVLISWWSMIPTAVNVALFVYRTYREDKMLIAGLAGYAEYAQKVKYRLLPRIW